MNRRRDSIEHRGRGEKAGLRTGFPGAFTLTELLIVIGIIVLLVVIAIPAFSIFRGERSIEAAENQLSAMVARARTEAVGYQTPGGVMFFRDARYPDRVSVAMVQGIETPDNATAEIYLDLWPDRDFLVLPVGVGLQVVDDCRTDLQKVRQDDAYINANVEARQGGANVKNFEIPIGGVILFDTNGRMMSVRYGFRIRNGANGAPTEMGNLLYFNPDPSDEPNSRVPNNIEYVEPGSLNAITGNKPPIRSQFGLIAYDLVEFNNAFPSVNLRERDPQMVGGTGTTYVQSEKAEEDWLDEHAIPLLVNRYNGTIMRGPEGRP